MSIEFVLRKSKVDHSAKEIETAVLDGQVRQHGQQVFVTIQIEDQLVASTYGKWSNEKLVVLSKFRIVEFVLERLKVVPSAKAAEIRVVVGQQV